MSSKKGVLRGKYKSKLIKTLGRVSCDICGKSFERRSILANHIRSKHLNYYVNCPICNKRYTSKSVVNRHLKRVHSLIFHDFALQLRCDSDTPVLPTMTESDDSDNSNGTSEVESGSSLHSNEEQIEVGIKIGDEPKENIMNLEDYSEVIDKLLTLIGAEVTDALMTIQSQFNLPFSQRFKKQFLQVLNDQIIDCYNQIEETTSGIMTIIQPGAVEDFIEQASSEEQFEMAVKQEPEVEYTLNIIASESDNDQSKSPPQPRKPRKYKKKEKKLFNCSICEYNCRKESDLTKHMRKHTGEKPFECYDCHMKFADSCNLRRHMRLHTGEKRYGCNYCSKRFMRSDDLNLHMKKVCQRRKKQTINSKTSTEDRHKYQTRRSMKK